MHPSVHTLTAQRGRPPRRPWRNVNGVSAPLAPDRSKSCHDGVGRPDRRRVSARCVPGTTARQDRLAPPDAQGRHPGSRLIIHGGVSNGRPRGYQSMQHRSSRRLKDDETSRSSGQGRRRRGYRMDIGWAIDSGCRRARSRDGGMRTPKVNEVAVATPVTMPPVQRSGSVLQPKPASSAAVAWKAA